MYYIITWATCHDSVFDVLGNHHLCSTVDRAMEFADHRVGQLLSDLASEDAQLQESWTSLTTLLWVRVRPGVLQSAVKHPKHGGQIILVRIQHTEVTEHV